MRTTASPTDCEAFTEWLTPVAERCQVRGLTLQAASRMIPARVFYHGIQIRLHGRSQAAFWSYCRSQHDQNESQLLVSRSLQSAHSGFQLTGRGGSQALFVHILTT